MKLECVFYAYLLILFCNIVLISFSCSTISGLDIQHKLIVLFKIAMPVKEGSIDELSIMHTDSHLLVFKQQSC